MSPVRSGESSALLFQEPVMVTTEISVQLKKV